MDNAALTFAIGDVHGCLAKFDDLLHRCADYAGPRPHQFVMLGDYIDRGPDSRSVVGRLRRLCEQRPDGVVCLMGNHEDMMLSAVEDPSNTVHWINNGGDATLKSYGVNAVTDLPADDIEWIRNLSLCHDDGLRFFVHAGIDPAVPLDRQSLHTMLWTREHAPDTLDPGRFIVHGHTPLHSARPEQHRYRLNLDTGAVYGGPLSAAAFAADQAAPIALLVGAKVLSASDVAVSGDRCGSLDRE
jgi:serine/threonine protein phosphatase 1